MYLEPEIQIIRSSDNTFVIQYKVKRKSKGKKSEILPRYEERVITAKDVEELKNKLSNLINKLPPINEEEEFVDEFQKE